MNYSLLLLCNIIVPFGTGTCIAPSGVLELQGVAVQRDARAPVYGQHLLRTEAECVPVLEDRPCEEHVVHHIVQEVHDIVGLVVGVQDLHLVPGVGAQGGSLEKVCQYGMTKDCGLLVNSSRGIIYAGHDENFATAAADAAKALQQQMEAELDKIKK